MKSRSVKRRLTLYVAVLQLMTVLGVVMASNVALFFSLSNSEAASLILDRLAEHIQRLPDGSLHLDAEGQAIVAAQSSKFWFHASDGVHALTLGNLPPSLEPFIGDAVPLLRDLSAWSDASTPAGTLSLVAGSAPPEMANFLSLLAGTFREVFFYLILPNIILIVLIVPRLVQHLMLPITDVTDAAVRIQAGKPGQRLPIQTAPVEVAPLIKAVNDALDRQDEWAQKKQRFIADAAHELRTPITVLQVRLDALPPGRVRDELQSDCRRLAALANQLLEIERVRAADIVMSKLDLNAVAHGAMMQFAPRATDQGADLSFEGVSRPLVISGNPELIESCIFNLLDNALRHGGPSIQVRVDGDTEPAIEILDSGTGIRAELEDSIFEPFVGTPGRGGGGLGLALVSEIMNAHGGRVRNVPSVDGRTCFRLEFPHFGSNTQG